MGSKVTPNLKIPIVDGADLVAKESINNASEAIDKHALPIEHKETKMHWDMWKAKTAYKKQDVFRTTTIPSWGYWEVTAAGTSGDSEPLGSGEGDTATDGSCELILRRLTSDSNGIVGVARQDDSLLFVTGDKKQHKISINDITHAQNADTAINDVNGNPITGYISSVSSSENKLTFAKGDGTNTEITLTSGNGIMSWKSNTAYNVGDIVYYDNNSIYLCQIAHTSGRLFADDFWPNWTKLDQKCVMKHSPMPNLISDGEVFFWDATGLRRSVTTQSGTPTTNNQFTSSYQPVPASLVDYDYTRGENYPHLFNEIAYCGNKRLYKCSKAEPLSLSNTSHGIESYSITGDLGKQTFYITKYDSNSDKYYSELVLKLPKTGTVTRVSFGRWYHVSGFASIYRSTGIVYTSSGGTNYKPAAIFALTDNVVAKFTAANCTHVKIRVYAGYGAGDHHSNTDTFETGSIDIQGLSSHWTQIKDERILEYDPSKTTYVSQDVAVFNRKLYRYGFGTNGSAPISEYNLETKKPFWESLIADIDHWTAGRLYDVGTTVLYNHKLYECIELHTSGIDFTADLTNTKEPKWVQVDGTNQANIATAKETIEAMTADFIEDD